jgi:hypothetical protein
MLQDTWNKVDVNLGYGELGAIVEWAKSNCTNNWNYEIIEQAGNEAGSYRFYFRDDKDAFAFTLWKK